MDRKEYEYQQGQQFGASSTLNQTRGVRDAAYELEKIKTADAFDRLTENQQQWSNHSPSLPERTSHIQQPTRRTELSKPTPRVYLEQSSLDVFIRQS